MSSRLVLEVRVPEVPEDGDGLVETAFHLVGVRREDLRALDKLQRRADDVIEDFLQEALKPDGVGELRRARVDHQQAEHDGSEHLSDVGEGRVSVFPQQLLQRLEVQVDVPGLLLGESDLLDELLEGLLLVVDRRQVLGPVPPVGELRGGAGAALPRDDEGGRLVAQHVPDLLRPGDDAALEDVDPLLVLDDPLLGYILVVRIPRRQRQQRLAVRLSNGEVDLREELVEDVEDLLAQGLGLLASPGHQDRIQHLMRNH
eukprot:158368-Hanusia_phi.AAC.2